ncbi:hypothetical protein KJ980_08665 [Patescibacteria group bacterium]|nr:hypothetical protein [Patescibacteria group bacterium]
MIKLVTQFDDPTKRVAISTPTCCCCCCCCIATITTSSAITYLNLNNIAKKTGERTNKKPNFIYSVAGLLLLPLLLVFLYCLFLPPLNILFINNVFPGAPGSVLLALITYLIALSFLYKKVGAGGKAIIYAVITGALTAVGSIADVYVANIFFYGNGSGYLLFASIFIIIAIVLFKLRIDKMI